MPSPAWVSNYSAVIRTWSSPTLKCCRVVSLPNDLWPRPRHASGRRSTICCSKRYTSGREVDCGSVVRRQHQAPSRQETNGWRRDRPVELCRLGMFDGEAALKPAGGATAASRSAGGGVWGAGSSALATVAGGAEDGFFSSLASKRRPLLATSLFGYFSARSLSFSVAQSSAPSSW